MPDEHSFDQPPPDQNEPLDRGNSFLDFAWLHLGWIILIALGAWVVSALILLSVLPRLGIWSLVICSPVFLLLSAWLRATSSAVKENYTDPDDEETSWKLRVIPRNMQPAEGNEQPRYEPPPLKQFRRLLPELGSISGPDETLREDEVPVCTREHKFFYYMRVGLPEVLGLVFLVLSFASAAGIIPFPWWAFLFAALATVPIGKVLSFPWKYKTVTVTSWCLRIDTKPPDWIPWWQPDPVSYNYSLIESIDPKRDWLGIIIGKFLGPGQTWGSIVLTLPGNQKIVIPRMPYYLEMARTIKTMQVSFQIFLSGGSDEATLLRQLVKNQRQTFDEQQSFFGELRQFIQRESG